MKQSNKEQYTNECNKCCAQCFDDLTKKWSNCENNCIHSNDISCVNCKYKND